MNDRLMRKKRIPTPRAVDRRFRSDALKSLEVQCRWHSGLVEEGNEVVTQDNSSSLHRGTSRLSSWYDVLKVRIKPTRCGDIQNPRFP